MLKFMVYYQAAMRGSLILLVVSCTFSYGFISKNKDQANAKNGNLQLDYFALDKDMNEQKVLNDQWQKKEKSTRRISKRQAPPDWILRAASREGYFAMVQTYIPLVNSVDDPDLSGWTALMWAAKNGHLEIVNLLLDNGAKVNHINHRAENALLWATYGQHKDIVIELIARGINVNQQEEKGISALMSAAIIGSTVLTNILLAAGADKFLKDDFQRTALIYAAKMGRTAVEDILADFHNINEVDKYGLTAIHHSVLLKNDMSTLEEGLTHCPDLTITDINGNTAEQVAQFVNNQNAYDIIQRHKRHLANGCWLDYDNFAAITKEFFDCREFQCHCYGNWTATGGTDPACEPKTVSVYSIQEMIAPWIARYFSLTTQSPEN